MLVRKSSADVSNSDGEVGKGLIVNRLNYLIQ